MTNKKKAKNNMQNFEDKLNEFNKKKPTPTSAIMNPLIHDEEEGRSLQENKLSKITKTKRKMEETHTRRTFLIKNDLLTRFDKKAKYIENKGFKTEFINYILEKGLDELDRIE